MPLKRCSVNNKSGWKWGDKGKCYTGPGGKKKAIKQGYAEDPEHFNEIMKSEGFTKDQETLRDIIVDQETTYKEALAILQLLTGNPMEIIIASEYVDAKKLK